MPISPLFIFLLLVACVSLYRAARAMDDWDVDDDEWTEEDT
jgi:hypothetical protein